MTDGLGVPLTRTVLITVALPDVYAEDFTKPYADEYYDGDFEDMFHEEMGLISSTVRVLVAHGDKGGNDLFDLRGVIVGMEVDGRDPKYDEPEDERLTDMIQEWRLSENADSTTEGSK